MEALGAPLVSASRSCDATRSWVSPPLSLTQNPSKPDRREPVHSINQPRYYLALIVRGLRLGNSTGENQRLRVGARRCHLREQGKIAEVSFLSASNRD